MLSRYLIMSNGHASRADSVRNDIRMVMCLSVTCLPDLIKNVWPPKKEGMYIQLDNR